MPYFCLIVISLHSVFEFAIFWWMLPIKKESSMFPSHPIVSMVGPWCFLQPRRRKPCFVVRSGAMLCGAVSPAMLCCAPCLAVSCGEVRCGAAMCDEVRTAFISFTRNWSGLSAPWHFSKGHHEVGHCISMTARMQDPCSKIGYQTFLYSYKLWGLQ